MATARVTVSFTFELTQPWGDDATVTEVVAAASREADALVRRMMRSTSGAQHLADYNIHIDEVRVKPK